MYCFNCGTKIPDDALFCGECGARQEVEGETIQWPVHGVDEAVENGSVQNEPIQNESLLNEPIQEEPIQNESLLNEPIQNEPFQPAPSYVEPVMEGKSGGGGKPIIIGCVVIIVALLAVIAYFIFGKEDTSQKDSVTLENLAKQEEEKEAEVPAPEEEEETPAAPVEEPVVQEAPEVPAEPEIPEEEEEEEAPQFVLPNSDTEVLSREDLRSLSQEELRIARNEIYARHGRKFQDEELQRYFESCDWYEGTYEPGDFPEDLLSQVEMDNRDLITEYEEFMGYR